jgi:hypothetical protein
MAAQEKTAGFFDPVVSKFFSEFWPILTLHGVVFDILIPGPAVHRWHRPLDGYSIPHKQKRPGLSTQPFKILNRQ